MSTRTGASLRSNLPVGSARHSSGRRVIEPLPPARTLLGDDAYDSHCFRVHKPNRSSSKIRRESGSALLTKTPTKPATSSNGPFSHLKDWRRVAIRPRPNELFFGASGSRTTVVKPADRQLKGFVGLPSDGSERPFSWISRACRLDNDFEILVNSSLGWSMLAESFCRSTGLPGLAGRSQDEGVRWGTMWFILDARAGVPSDAYGV